MKSSRNARLRVEQLEGRDTPSTLTVEPQFNPQPEPPGRNLEPSLGVLTAAQRASTAAQTHSIVIAGGIDNPNLLPGNAFAHQGVQTAEYALFIGHGPPGIEV